MIELNDQETDETMRLLHEIPAKYSFHLISFFLKKINEQNKLKVAEIDGQKKSDKDAKKA